MNVAQKFRLSQGNDTAMNQIHRIAGHRGTIENGSVAGAQIQALVDARPVLVLELQVGLAHVHIRNDDIVSSLAAQSAALKGDQMQAAHLQGIYTCFLDNDAQRGRVPLGNVYGRGKEALDDI